MEKIRLITMLCLCVLIGSTAWAQESKTTGRVTDASGEVIIGALVSQIGTKNVVATDTNGQFAIDAPQGSELSVTYLGFAPQTVRVSGGPIEVALKESATMLDQVVVIGYGTSRRKDITGSVASVSADKLAKTPAPSLNAALQGKAAGVRVTLGDNAPGGGVGVQIRGLNSISQSNAPIYVVDGVIMQGTLNNINVNDIASIDILKDASSAAIYGSRAANGVVIVTTKKGTQGKGQIRFDGKVSLQSALNMPQMLTAQQLAEIRIEGNVNNQLNSFYNANPNLTAGEYGDRFNELKGKYMQEYPLSMFSETERKTLLAGESYNWYDEIAQQGIVQDYSLSFSGGDQKGNYYISLNYYDHQGLVVDSRFSRYSARANGEYNVNKWLKVGLNNVFTHSNTRTVGTSIDAGIGAGLGANPMIPFVDENGVRPEDIPFYTSEGQPNPVLARSIKNDLLQNRYLGHLFANITFIPELQFRTAISVDVVDNNQGLYTPSTVQTAKADKGQATIKNENWLDFMWDNTLTFNKTWDSKHTLTAMIGATVQSNTYRGNQQYGTGFSTDVLGYNNMGGATKFPSAGQWSSVNRWQIASFMARATYNYDDRYMVTGTVRLDGNSKYGADNKWGVFPSVAASWRLSREQFLKEATWIDELKLRVGWGQLGNSNLAAYSSFSKLVPGVAVGPDGKPVNTIQNTDQLLGNPDIRWERQEQINLGLDFGFFDGRLWGSVDAYQSTSRDLLLRTPMPVTTGYLNMYSNVGELRNRGFEVALGGEIIRSNKVTWSLDLNWSTNHNELTELYGGVTERINSASSPTGAGWWVGEPLGAIYTYQYDGLWKWGDNRELMDKMKDGKIGGDRYYPGENKIVDQDGDNQITTKDRAIVGYTDPLWYGGFSTMVTYAGFSLDLNFNYTFGNKVFNRSYHEYTLGAGYGFQNMMTDQMDRYTVWNEGTSIPRANSNNLDRLIVSSRVMEDGSFLRLKTATLAYNFPSDWMKRIHVNSLRLYVTGENLFTITSYKGVDPESPSWGKNETYPNASGVSFGIQVGF